MMNKESSNLYQNFLQNICSLGHVVESLAWPQDYEGLKFNES